MEIQENTCFDLYVYCNDFMMCIGKENASKLISDLMPHVVDECGKTDMDDDFRQDDLVDYAELINLLSEQPEYSRWALHNNDIAEWKQRVRSEG